MVRWLLFFSICSIFIFLPGCGGPPSDVSQPPLVTPGTGGNSGGTADEPKAPASIFLATSLPVGSKLPQEGETTVTAFVTDSAGQAVANGTNVKFSTSSSGSSITGSDTTSNGLAEATFQAGSAGGVVTITALAGSISNEISITIDSGGAASIIKESVLPQTIGISGSGIEDTSQIKFLVRDNKGNPAADGTTVDFSIGTPVGGGERLSATSAVTAGGSAVVSLQSGTVPGTVKIIASITTETDVISTEAMVTIVSNHPDAGRITMGAEVLNLAGGVTLGLQSKISAYLGDRSGNVVPDGTPVSFISECGTVGESGGFETSTKFGVASAVFQTSAPDVPNLAGLTPQGNKGQCRVVAYTPGRGTFEDSNGNGVFDSGIDVCTTHLDEPYIDANDSGDFEEGESYVDINKNSQFDRDIVDCINDSMLWTSMNLLISDYAKPLSINPQNFNITIGESQAFTLDLSDIWDNALVAGTKLKITVDGGKIVGLSEYTVPDTTGLGQKFSFLLSSDMPPTDPEKPAPQPAFVTVTATLEPASGVNNNGAGLFAVATGMINLPVPDPATFSVFVNSDLPPGTSLTQGETCGIKALLRYSDGTVAPDGTIVVFSTSGGTLKPSTAPTVNGEATTTFTAPNIGGPVQIKASALGGESLTSLDISNGDATTIIVNNITSPQIGVRGSGLGDSTIITFDVFDQDGNTAPDGTNVIFALSSTTGGGERLSSAVDQTFNGQVSVTLQSGVRAGTAALTASIQLPDNSQISTVARVIIAAGLPDAKHFSLSALPLNLPGYSYFGENSEIRAYLADRYSNPVPEGTPIFFESEAGAMALSNVRTDALGQATATHVTQQPLPDTISISTGLEGVSKILAWTAGSESFVDYNGNGTYDSGEPFDDIGEPFIDANDNGSYDEALSVLTEERYVDVNGNGKYDPPNGAWDGQTYIWADIDILWSGIDQADIQFSLTAADPTDMDCSNLKIPYGGACTFNLSVTDQNKNPLMGGTTISLINTWNQLDDPSDTDYVLSEAGFTVPDTTYPGPNRTTFSFTISNPKTTAGDYPTDFQIKVSGNKGLEKISNFAITLKGL